MGKTHHKYKIDVLRKTLILEKSDSTVGIQRLIKANQETIEFLKKNGYRVCLEMRLKKFDAIASTDTPDEIYDSSSIPIFYNPQFYNSYRAKFIDAKTCKNIHGKTRIKYKGKDGVFRVTIPADEIEAFLKGGTITNRFANEPVDISIKVLKPNDNDGEKLASFKLTDSLQLNVKNNNSIAEANEYSLFAFSSFLNCISQYRLQPKIDKKHFALKRKPYFLARLASFHSDNDKANENNNKSAMRKVNHQHNVPYSYYEGIVAHIDIQNSKASSWHKADASISLSPPKEMEWVDINGELFLPINYSPEYLNSNKGFVFEEKSYSDQILMRPYDKNLALITLIHNPVTNQWERNVIPFTDQNTTTIYFDEKNNIWKSQNTDIWGAISSEPIRSLTGINNNFSVVCTYTEKYTFGVARGLNKKTVSAQIEDRCIPLINFIPETKQKRKDWSETDEIVIQQSTLGLESDKMAFLVKIDPLTNKVIYTYDMNNLAGTKIWVSAEEFRNGSIALALGPNRCRLDISPAPRRYAVAAVTETHGIFAGGYSMNDKKQDLSFNY